MVVLIIYLYELMCVLETLLNIYYIIIYVYIFHDKFETLEIHVFILFRLKEHNFCVYCNFTSKNVMLNCFVVVVFYCITSRW